MADRILPHTNRGFDACYARTIREKFAGVGAIYLQEAAMQFKFTDGRTVTT
jgi:hypothetical protein